MSENAIQKVVITSSRWNTQRILDGARSEGLAEFQLIQCEGTGESLRQIVDADVVIIGLWNPQLLNAARKLRWVHSGGGGVEGLLSPSLLRVLFSSHAASPTMELQEQNMPCALCSCSLAASTSP